MHRFFTHRSFKTSRAFRFILGLVGMCTFQRGPLWWSSQHRYHHIHCETNLDPHSPAVHGFWESYIFWLQ
eukprot:UN18995